MSYYTRVNRLNLPKSTTTFSNELDELKKQMQELKTNNKVLEDLVKPKSETTTHFTPTCFSCGKEGHITRKIAPTESKRGKMLLLIHSSCSVIFCMCIKILTVQFILLRGVGVKHSKFLVWMFILILLSLLLFIIILILDIKLY